MALARVVSFDGVDAAQIEKLRQEIGEGGRPDEVPATEIVILHDPEAERSLAILFFDTEEDYRRGDAALDAMPAGDTPGSERRCRSTRSRSGSQPERRRPPVSPRTVPSGGQPAAATGSGGVFAHGPRERREERGGVPRIADAIGEVRRGGVEEPGP